MRLKAIVKVAKFLYPKCESLDNGEWAIISVYVDKVIEGTPKLSKYKTLTLKGLVPPTKVGEKLYFEGEAVFDEKYKSYNYNISVLGKNVDIESNSPVALKTFLLMILKNEEMVEDILNLGDINKIFENKDIDKLTTVKGIGKVRANKIIETYHNSKTTFKYTNDLASWGVTDKLLLRLQRVYGENIVEIHRKVKENPYILATEVKGIGFKRADDIAQKMLIPLDSVYRYKAFILYYLNSEVENGRAYIFNSELMGAINENLGNDINMENLVKAIHLLHSENKLWWSDDKSVLALVETRNLEQNLALEIKRLNTKDDKCLNVDWLKIVKDLEKEQGWEHSTQQLKGIETVLNNNLTVITGLAGCVDCATEYFNGYRWKKISDYKNGDKVLQYNMDGTATLVEPYAYIKKECDTLYHLKTHSNRVNQVLSLDHNFVYLNKTNKISSIPFKDLIKKHETNKVGTSARVITTFDYEGKGIDLTNEQIKVMLMVLADGTFTSKIDDNKKCIVQFKKQRKIDRAEIILKEANIEYVKTSYENGYTSFTFIAPLKEKNFESYWYDCNKEQLKLITDEVIFWDGSYASHNRRRFYTTSKGDADFVQFAFSSCGFRATIHTTNRVGEVIKNKAEKHYVRKSIEYCVNISFNNKTVGLRGDSRSHKNNSKATIEEYKTVDGFMYCFSVPSTMLVLRRADRIFITGNSGKTTVSSAMVKVLVDTLNYSLEQTTLSGKASHRLAMVTGKEAKTIHRLLEYNPSNGFLRNKNNPIDTDIVIIDEASMIDSHLFLRLLEAIRSGTKVVLLGDYGQLTSIGLGTVLKDLISTMVVPVVKLDTVYRQGKTSAINSKAIDIRNGKQITDRYFEGTVSFGDLKDFELICYNDKDEVPLKVLEEFKKHLNRIKNIMDVQVITATKSRGNSGAYVLNRLIKNYYNPIKEGEKFAKIKVDNDKDYFISVDDKVLITKNNYKVDVFNTITKEYTEGSIFNGSMGIVKQITNDYMFISLEGIGLIRLKIKTLDCIELGYAITVHKSQGSQFDTVLFPLDYSAYTLLSRQLVYTGITRASKHCALICENNALMKATNTNEVVNKLSFLNIFLKS